MSTQWEDGQTGTEKRGRIDYPSLVHEFPEVARVRVVRAGKDYGSLHAIHAYVCAHIGNVSPMEKDGSAMVFHAFKCGHHFKCFKNQSSSATYIGRLYFLCRSEELQALREVAGTGTVATVQLASLGSNDRPDVIEGRGHIVGCYPSSRGMYGELLAWQLSDAYLTPHEEAEWVCKLVDERLPCTGILEALEKHGF